MKFVEWAEKHRLSDRQAGDLIGTSAETARRYRMALRIPEWPIMLRIYDVSKGRVTPNDFLKEHHHRIRLYAAAE